MKVVILAGGAGTRLAEETEIRPKPMVEIGGRPILWHLMKQVSTHGLTEFVVALGYRGEVIKRYFVDQAALAGSLSVSLRDSAVRRLDGAPEDWTVHLIETGAETMTGGRLKRVGSIVGNDPFLLTYGDGVANVDIGALLRFHRSHGRLATITAVRPPARFGGLEFNGDQVTQFIEKPQIGEGWINGGFFVLHPEVIELIEGDATTWEREPLEALARRGELMAFRHEGFWQCMDTLRDKRLLEALWSQGNAPWKIWD